MWGRRLKIILFILLIILLFIIVFFSIFGTSLSYLSVKEIKEGRKEKKDLVNSFKINNVDTAYDKNSNTYYYTIPDNYENNNYILKLELDNGYRYKIINHKINIIKVSYKDPIDIIIYNDKYYYETKIQLTNLPIVNIYAEEEITEYDTNAKFNYTNLKSVEKIKKSNIKMKIRGISARLFDKKSYRINIYNDTYSKEKNIQISNFYYGDSLILDAIYRDPSKIRNVLSTKLWNDMSNDFSSVDIYSEYVELFINNEYKGLYVLTEPVNKTKLGLNKNSIVIKSNDWINDLKKDDFSKIYEDTYLSFELKYPNDESKFSDSWKKYFDIIFDYYSKRKKNTDEVIKNTFNINNYLDIVIFNAFINNLDSCLVKNLYFYLENSNKNVLNIQPWDMEYSFGLLYDQNYLTLATKNNDSYSTLLCSFNQSYAPEINKLLINRYWELRKNVLTKEYFDELLDEYKKELTKGAASRDSELWYEYDIEKEIEDVRTWIYKRLDFFDEYVSSLKNEQ